MQKTASRIINETRTVDYEYLENSDKFVTYTVTTHCTITTPNGEVTTEERSTNGVTNLENLESIKGFDKIDDKVADEDMYNGWGIICGISKENMEKVLNAKMHISEAVRKYEDGDIPVIWNIASYDLKDIHGNWIPLPVKMGYMCDEGQITSAYYELAEVKEYLEENKDNFAGKIIGEIERKRVPYYNAEIENEDYLSFYYLPTQEEQNELKKRKKKYMSDIKYVMDELLRITKLRNTEEQAE